MEKQDLFLDCLRRTVDVYRRGTFNRYETVACLATCIDIHMRQRRKGQMPGLKIPQRYRRSS